MTREEAEEYAKNMSYRNAVYNALQGKCIPYRKATLIKLYELLDMIEPQKSEVEDMASESLREAHDEALWKIHRVRTMNGNVYVVAVGDVMDTLDKIKAEIETAYEDLDGYDPDALPIYIERVREIIDKYRKERE